jgi:magnesium transporter
MPSNEAHSLLTSAVPTCHEEETAGSVLSLIQSTISSYQSIDYIYVLDGKKLVGVFSIHELFSAPTTATVGSFMVTKLAFAHIHTDKEHIVQIALAESIKAVPVIGETDEFVGVVLFDEVFSVLSEQSTTHLFHSAGIRRFKKRHEELSIVEQLRSRTPWLVLGLFGGLGGAMIINSFEKAIEHEVFIAAFIPAVIYIADAVGNQTEMLVVRALGRAKHFSLKHYLFREITVGFLLSALLALLMFLLSFLWLQKSALSLVLTISIIATTLFSIIFTVVLPWVLKRLHFDPAVASGPIATVVCDISSVAIYLTIATSVL